MKAARCERRGNIRDERLATDAESDVTANKHDKKSEYVLPSPQ
jgi:hypothetical protein